MEEKKEIQLEKLKTELAQYQSKKKKRTLWKPGEIIYHTTETIKRLPTTNPQKTGKLHWAPNRDWRRGSPDKRTKENWETYNFSKMVIWQTILKIFDRICIICTEAFIYMIVWDFVINGPVNELRSQVHFLSIDWNSNKFLFVAELCREARS